MNYSNQFFFLKTFKKLAKIMALLYLALPTFAQNYPIQATVLAPPPYPYLISDYMTRTGETVLILTNTDPFNTYKAKIGANISGDNGIFIQTDFKKPPTQPITLGPGESRIFTGDDILNLYSNHSIDDIAYSGIDPVDLIQSQTVPEGIYTACVRVYDFSTNEPLSMEMPGGCTPPIPIFALDPPIITTPIHEEKLKAQNPQNIIFKWTPVAGAQVPILYKFRLVEVPDGVNPYDAIESDNFLIYEEEDNMINVKIYDNGHPFMEVGRMYAVQVTAYDFENTTLIRNEGKSDVVVFQYNRPLYDPPVIIHPSNESIVNLSNGPFIPFNWTSVSTPEPPLYKLKIAEVPDGFSPFHALAFDTYTVFEEEDLSSSNLMFDSNQYPLDSTKNYAARVQVYDPFDFYTFRNAGKSDIVSFTIQGSNNEEEDPEEEEEEEEEEDDNEPEVVTPPVVGNFDCGEGCEIALSDNLTAVNTFQTGSQVQLGNFVLELGDITYVGNNIWGSGKIMSTDFMPFPLRVNINGIRINSEGQVVEGFARGAHQEAFLTVDWINEDAIITPDFTSTPEEIANDLDQFAENLDDIIDPQVDLGISLPLSFGGNDNRISIVGIDFRSTGATYNLVSTYLLPGDIRQGSKYLAFGANDLCYSPGGLGAVGEDAQLVLLETVTFEPNDKYDITFFEGDINGNNSQGCFMRIDCDGFVDLVVEGYTSFSRDFIVPDDGNGAEYPGKVGAFFETVFTEWTDWIIELDFEHVPVNPIGVIANTPFFQFKELPDFTIQVQNVILDNSELQNGENMDFPIGYPNNDEEWMGVFFETAELRIPSFLKKNGQRISFSIQDLLIDEAGLTGSMHTNNLIQEEDNGDLGGWDFTMNSIQIDLMQNELEQAEFEGTIKVPLLEEPIGYQADIEYLNNQSFYEFQFANLGEFQIPAWGANIEIAPNSFLDIEVLDGEVSVAADLTGTLDFNSSIGGIDQLAITGIVLEHLRISNHDPYITLGDWGFNYQIPPSVFGFDIEPENIAFDADDTHVYITLFFDIELGGQGHGIAGKTDMTIASRYFTEPNYNIVFDYIEFNNIELEADFVGIYAKGGIDFYEDDPVYGNYFGGNLSVSMLSMDTINLEGKFGSRLTNHEQLMFYWYLDGNYVTDLGIPVVSPVSMYSFGGGAYYNMERQGNNVVPRQNRFGLYANVGLGMDGQKAMYNGEFQLEAVFNTNNGLSLNNISFTGAAAMLKEPSFNNYSNAGAPVTMDCEIVYDYANSRLFGNFDANINMSPIVGNGEIEFNIEADRWKLFIGEPTDPMIISYQPGINILGRNYSIGSVDFQTYFAAANNYDISFPPLPSQLSQWTLNQVSPPAAMGSSGFITGLKTGFDIDAGFDVDLWFTSFGVHFHADAGIGGDIGFLKYNTSPCSNVTNFGYNGWYARGQGYLYGHASLSGHIGSWGGSVSAGFEAVGTFGFPRPTGFKGAINLYVGLGPVDLSFRETLKVGEHCESAGADALLSTIADIQLIENGTIEDGEVVEELRLNELEIGVNFFFEPNTDNVISDGDTEIRYWLEIQNFELYRIAENGLRRTVDDISSAYPYNNPYQRRFYPDFTTLQLEPDTEYEVYCRARIRYQENGSSPRTLQIEGNLITESLRYRFRTQALSFAMESNYGSLPKEGEKYFHWEDVDEGFVKGLTAYVQYRNNDNYQLLVRFINQETNGVLTGSNVQFNTVGGASNYHLISFNIPNLQPETPYHLEILARHRRGGSDQEIYCLQFNTSQYPTMMDKLDDLTVSVADASLRYDAYTNESHMQYKLDFETGEPFDFQESLYVLYDFYENNQTDNSNGVAGWLTFRTGLKNLMQNHGVSPYPNLPELDPYTNNSNVEESLSSGCSNNLNFDPGSIGDHSNNYTADNNGINLNLGNFGNGLPWFPNNNSGNGGNAWRVLWQPDRYYKANLQKASQEVDWDSLSFGERLLLLLPISMPDATYVITVGYVNQSSPWNNEIIEKTVEVTIN